MKYLATIFNELSRGRDGGAWLSRMMCAIAKNQNILKLRINISCNILIKSSSRAEVTSDFSGQLQCYNFLNQSSLDISGQLHYHNFLNESTSAEISDEQIKGDLTSLIKC